MIRRTDLSSFRLLPGLLVLLLSGLLAQEAFAADKLTISRVAFEPPTVAPGGSTTLVIVAEPDANWHLYGMLEEIGLAPSLSMDPKTWKGHLLRKGGFQVGDGKPHESMGMTSYWQGPPRKAALAKASATVLWAIVQPSRPWPLQCLITGGLSPASLVGRSLPRPKPLSRSCPQGRG